MKKYVFAALALIGVAFSPSLAGAAEGCLGDETFTRFKASDDGSVVVKRHEGGEYKITLSEKPKNLTLMKTMKVRSSGDCLAGGDEVIMSGPGGNRAKYKVVSVEQVAAASSAAAE
jgi:hypothetical protein